MAKEEKKERKKSGKVGSSRAKSPAAEELTPEGRVKKVMELTSCSESVAEMVLLSNNDLEAAVLAVLDLPNEDADSWKEGGKVHKPKKQNDAVKGKPAAQGNRRGDLQTNRVRSNPNESRQVNRRAARESQRPRQVSIAGAPANGRQNTGRNVVPRQGEKLDDRKPPSAGPTPVDLESKDELPDWRNGPLVFEKAIPPSPIPIQVSVLPKSDKPTFAEIAANKKTIQIPMDEPKLPPACVDEFQLDDHSAFSVSGGQHKQSIHSPPVAGGSAPVLDLVVNEEYTKKLKTDIGFQTDHIGEFAVAARVKSLKEDGEFFATDEAKNDQFCSLEEPGEEEPMEKSQKPLLMSYVNASMLSSPSKKPVYQKEVSKIDKQIGAVPKSVDKQIEVVPKVFAQNPSVQQQAMVQNMPLDFQHLSPACQQLVITLAAQLSNSVPFNQMQPLPPLQSMQIPGNPLETSHMLGRMMHGQQMLQGQPMVSQQPRVDRAQSGQPTGGMFGWHQQQQSMSSQPGQQVRMHGGMEAPPGFPQAYASEYQAMLKFQADQQVPSSFDNQRVIHGAGLPQMQQPSVALVNPAQRSLAGHGFPQNYGYGIAANGGGPSQQMPQNQISGSYGAPFMQNYQQR